MTEEKKPARERTVLFAYLDPDRVEKVHMIEHSAYAALEAELAEVKFELECTEKVYRQNRDWIENAKVEIERLKDEKSQTRIIGENSLANSYKVELAAAKEEMICSFCQNTGKHACPDVAPYILVPCSRKGCVYGELNVVKDKNYQLRLEIDTRWSPALKLEREKAKELYKTINDIAHYNGYCVDHSDDHQHAKDICHELAGLAKEALAKYGE